MKPDDAMPLAPEPARPLRALLVLQARSLLLTAAIACLCVPTLHSEEPPAEATERASWRAGLGRVDITPEEPIWLAGYAARKEPSKAVAGPIEVKALALESASGGRALAITCDLITMPRQIAEPVARRLAARFALPRSRILFTASHSHSSPALDDALIGMYFLDAPQRERIERYTTRVAAALEEAGARALADLVPAKLFVARGEADFAINRRRVNADDPVDHSVPILHLTFERGPDDERPRHAVWFSYACHNTTLDGLDVCGDWAGFAQTDLESASPGLVALFSAGCGGDQNPDPRRTMDLAKSHGHTIAESVRAALEGKLVEVSPRLRCAFGHADLPLVAPPSEETLRKEAESTNAYVAQLARKNLALRERGEEIPSSLPWPAQVWRLGEEAAIVAMGGEVVVDYSLRLRRELASSLGESVEVIPIAYANDVPAYIPSERVLAEGGYEGATSMVYYGVYGPWAPGIEERVMERIHSLVAESFRASSLAELPPGDPADESAQSAFEVGLEPVFTDGAFTEGPSFGPDGGLWFTDIPNDRILRFEHGETRVAREPSGKANGLAFDALGRLVACEGADGGRRRVTRTERDGTITVLAERIDGKRFNGPNDLAIDAAGRVWFSDPRWSLARPPARLAGEEPRELDVEAVYRIDQPGQVVRAIDGLVRPNGLAFSPDGETLYVSDEGAGTLLAFRIAKDGTATRAATLFDFGEGRAIDGMEVDVAGNIWAAAGRAERTGIWVFAADGTLLEFFGTQREEIDPEAAPGEEGVATNCAFGEDGRTLFATAGGALYRMRLRQPGLPASREKR